MLDALLEDYSGIIPFSEYLQEVDILFIKELIFGTPEKERKGRYANKFFLYEIINNTLNGIDVDRYVCICGTRPVICCFLLMFRFLLDLSLHFSNPLILKIRLLRARLYCYWC